MHGFEAVKGEALEVFTLGFRLFTRVQVAQPYTPSITTLPEAEISIERLHNPHLLSHAKVHLKVEALNVTCNQLTPNKICWP